ncbi:MAG: ATP-binding cassette domain-containing protein [Thioalkalispiraceae bacterium]|jgi:ATP-binding cassette subfamily F protein uup
MSSSSPLLKLSDVCLSFGDKPLLDHVDLDIFKGERICLVGRNGAGKSSLLRVVSGQHTADDGQVWQKDGLRIAYLEQHVPSGGEASVFQVVASGLAELGELISEYHQVAHSLEQNSSAEQVQKLSDLQHQLEAADGWLLEQKVESVISRLDLPADALMASLSGGLKRRVLLARALVSDPDLLLLDEPTNHLDVAGVSWLEEYLSGFQGALLFITHDRTFLQKLATRIIELDRGMLSSWPGDFAHYLQKKEEREAVEAEQRARFDRKLAEEEAWIRQGIKARRTRNEGRVRALKALREQQRQRRDQQGKVRLNLDEADRSGKLVAELEDVSFSFNGKPVIKQLSTRILRGDRIGIMGPNGAGKTTLIRLLLGELQPQSGTVNIGTKLKVAYFDQQQSDLELDKSVLDNINDGKETVTINGKSRHVISYLRDFLFPAQKINAPVKTLSGGERNRLLLAKMFTRPANMLVMDEPTNDLDMETLELLEELLANFEGTLILVSHDRSFLDNVVSSLLVFEGDHRVREYVGGYSDWVRQRPRDWSFNIAGQAKPKPSPEPKPANDSPVKQAAKPRKLSYKEQRELDALPEKIEALEQEQEQLQQLTSQADFYQQTQDTIATTLERLKAVGQQLDDAYQRWESLDA